MTQPAADSGTSGPRGVYCPVITPLDADEWPDEAALRHQIGRLVAGVDGIMVLGTGGEFPLLEPAAADAAAEIVADELRGRLPLVCGVGDTGVRRTVANLRRAEKIGADYVAVCGPYYYRVDAAALYRHFATVADLSAVPVVIYNIPPSTQSGLDRDTLTRLAEHPNIVGIKESSGDAGLLTWLLDARADLGLTVLQGTAEQEATRWWRADPDGYVSGLENVAPGTMRELAEAVRTGDDAAARRLQHRLNVLVGLCDRHYWLAVIKAGCAEYGAGDGRLAAPLPTLDPPARDEVRAALSALGLLTD